MTSYLQTNLQLQNSLPKYKRWIEKFIIRFPYPVKSVLSALGREKSPYLPRYVKIETTNACNGQCTYCPRDKMTRKVGFINDYLFRKIVDECSALGIQSIHLQNYGEPLLDKKLVERIRYIKNKSIPHAMIFSNGLLLTKVLGRKLIESGLDEISVSLDPGPEVLHNRIRIHLPYKTVVKNLESFISLKKEIGSKKPTLIVSSVVTEENYQEVEPFLHKWKPLVDRIDIQPAHNWGFNSQRLRQEYLPCSRLWNTLTILWDGSVSLCCVDFNGKYLLGDVSESTIEEIWNGTRYRKIRRENLGPIKNLNPLCKLCTLPLKDSPLWIKNLLPFFRPSW